MLVRKEGLEPSRLAVLTPEASASTNSAIFAYKMVIPMRFELMTTGFGNRYSIQLSYGIILMKSHSFWATLYTVISKFQVK